MGKITFTEKTQKLEFNEYGYLEWVPEKKKETFDTSEVTLILCDVWDRHWARCFTERVERAAPYFNYVTKKARERGIQIIHGPSATTKYYEGHPARERVKNLPQSPIIEKEDIEVPRHPLVHEPYSMDTGEPNSVMQNVWLKIHDGIEIFDNDIILEDDYQEFCNLVNHYKFKKYIIMGGATNMCMLHREFALLNQKRMGLSSLFVRDCSIVAYSPQCAPYVPFKEAQEISMDYIEKFICPSIMSEDFLSFFD